MLWLNKKNIAPFSASQCLMLLQQYMNHQQLIRLRFMVCQMVKLLQICTTGRHMFVTHSNPLTACYCSDGMKHFPKSGAVVCRQYVDSDPIQNVVLKKGGFLGFPEKLNPKGLSCDRKKYLYTQIHQHFKQGSENLVAPNPNKQKF